MLISVFGSYAALDLAGRLTPPEKLSNMRALMVDDNFTNPRILTGALTVGGMDSTAVEDGYSALRELELCWRCISS